MSVACSTISKHLYHIPSPPRGLGTILEEQTERLEESEHRESKTASSRHYTATLPMEPAIVAAYRRPTQYLASQHFCMHQKCSQFPIPRGRATVVEGCWEGEGLVAKDLCKASGDKGLPASCDSLSDSNYPISPGAHAVCTRASACANSALPRSCITAIFNSVVYHPQGLSDSF